MTDSFADRIAAIASQLEDAARTAGMNVAGDRRISECDTATLLCYSLGHFRQMRMEGRAPRAMHLGMNGARLSYRFDDVAEWLETLREKS